MVLAQLAAERGMSFVCVQPAALVVGPQKSEDLTTDKTDDKDAVLIARLTGQLRCYLPEPVDEANATWTRLRHLRRPPGAAARESTFAAVQTDPGTARVRVASRARDSEAPVPLSHVGRRPDRRGSPKVTAGTWTAHRRLGLARFERAVRAEVARRGGIRPCLPIVRRPLRRARLTRRAWW